MISVEGLTVEFGVKPLFLNASFVINDRDRIALVGKNGAGKSTMLKILWQAAAYKWQCSRAKRPDCRLFATGDDTPE